MARVNFFTVRSADLAQPAMIPAGRMDRLQQSFRRRLSDSIEEVFHRACLSNDLETANDLFAIMENIHRRGASINGGLEQRTGSEDLARAREMLRRCRERQDREPCMKSPAN